MEAAAFIVVVVVVVSLIIRYLPDAEPRDDADDERPGSRALRLHLEGVAKQAAAADKPTMAKKAYPVSLVGEQHYQAAIGQLRQGDRVTVWHEPDNPYDDLALAVTDGAGRTIGYVPKDCFLQRAVHEEGQGCRATVGFLGRGDKGFTHVSLDAELCDEPIEERKYRRG